MTLHVLLAVLAILSFAAAAAGIPSRVGLTPLGLLFLTLLLVLS